ncbi:MAG TPA: GTPase Era [Alphaproteobacteria bacterium]|nr:GTPase Era [Alphaproteobacteria bacterium]
MSETTRAGFVAVLGAPNVGKSTLVNRLVGSKVSIVSPKVQTTRARVMGIAMRGTTQVAFLDLPGVFAPKRRLDRAMIDAAWRGAADADVVLLLIDAIRGLDDNTETIIAGLTERGIEAVAAINKIDLVKRPALLGLAASLNARAKFAATFMLSASTGDGVDDLMKDLMARMPEGPFLYPEDQLTDMSERLLAAEITREQLFLQLHQELPYSVAVETEKWEEFKDGSARVEQVIYVQRDSQRKIVIGEKGARIKAIGAAARTELACVLGRKVHLFLHVKVAEDWAEKRDFYRVWGLEYDA